jgi:hypothetical protein
MPEPLKIIFLYQNLYSTFCNKFEEERKVYKVLVGKPKGNRPLRRLRRNYSTVVTPGMPNGAQVSNLGTYKTK